MRTKRWPTTLGWSAFVFFQAALSGPGIPVEVRSLPAWPGEARIENFVKQFVFRDSWSGEIVVTYPDPRDPGRRVTFHFWLQNRVDPDASVAIAVNAEGIFTYEHTLSNGPTGMTPIQMWSVVGPADSKQTISHPTWGGTNGWQSRAGVQALLENEAHGAFLIWGSRGDSVAPGAELTGFRITSSFRPGFTTAYAIGDGGITSPGEVPEEVVQQLIPVQRPAVIWRPFLTIGPRFGPEIPLTQIIRKYREEISWLTKHGALDGHSPYVQELSRAIARCDALGRIEGFPLAQSPKSKIEVSLARALQALQSPKGR